MNWPLEVTVGKEHATSTDFALHLCPQDGQLQVDRCLRSGGQSQLKLLRVVGVLGLFKLGLLGLLK
jgi:hypothetical protein